MKQVPNTAFGDRLQAAAEARKAALAKFQPKPSVSNPEFVGRSTLKAAELEEVRKARTEAKAAKKQAIADAEAAAIQAREAAEAAGLDAKRGERKERKALTKAEAKAKRDARYAARKAR